jgi:outer membrane protein assembly factor BamD
MKKLYLYCFFVILLVHVVSKKALKKDDVAIKFEVGTKLYDAGNYTKAIRLLNK